MLWAGAGVVWTIAGGIPRSAALAATVPEPDGFRFVQISDSHLGFSAAPNTEVTATLQAALDQARRVTSVSMMIHTGDVSHLSRAAQFDTAAQVIGATGIETHYVPGEHDVLDDDGKSFFARFTQAGARGYYSFDQQGVHFIGLNNVQNLQAGGLGFLGAEQIDWVRRDLEGRAASQPIVVFAHVPLWTVSAEWGWGTSDAAQILALLRPFGSVTVLNGHIHQVMQKIEGKIAFHTARSTAFPQPAPGSAPSPGPIKTVPPGQLRELLGITSVSLVSGDGPLALVDTTLEG
jgi:3',5'-cyclic AMP phosphodiesterase CpdA